MVRPDPIPNSAVKRCIADGSACIACARVGSRRFFHSPTGARFTPGPCCALYTPTSAPRRPSSFNTSLRSWLRPTHSHGYHASPPTASVAIPASIPSQSVPRPDPSPKGPEHRRGLELAQHGLPGGRYPANTPVRPDDNARPTSPTLPPHTPTPSPTRQVPVRRCPRGSHGIPTIWTHGLDPSRLQRPRIVVSDFPSRTVQIHPWDKGCDVFHFRGSIA